jgi:DNA-binding XRE family transcriptional regulator
MEESDFWRDLAERFRVIRRDDFAGLRADWQDITIGRQTTTQWDLRSASESTVSQFTAAARRGGIRLKNTAKATDLLHVWLNNLRSETDPSSRQVIAVEYDQNGLVTNNARGGSIQHVCQVSANFCNELESLALEAEQAMGAAPQVQSSVPKSKIKRQTIGEQIDGLREECRLTIEQLAHEIKVNPRTVQRHLADEATPYLTRLRAYERVFSKLLNRQVVISKMP